MLTTSIIETSYLTVIVHYCYQRHAIISSHSPLACAYCSLKRLCFFYKIIIIDFNLQQSEGDVRSKGQFLSSDWGIVGCAWREKIKTMYRPIFIILRRLHY